MQLNVEPQLPRDVVINDVTMSMTDALFALKDEGITQERANAANEEVEQLKNVSRKPTSHHPLIFFEHGADTRRASNQFLEVCCVYQTQCNLELTNFTGCAET